MTYKSIFKTFFNDILTLVFPEKCSVCGKIIESGFVCGECFKALRFIHEPSCRSCTMEINLCRCKNSENIRPFAAAAALEYDHASSKIIGDFKFRGKRRIAGFFVPIMVKRCNECFGTSEIDCVTYVPMNLKSERARGFNQAKLLAEKIAENIGVPCEELIKKTGKNKIQHNLPKRERILNVKNVYSINPNADCKNKTILLADDVFTTGSTVGECSKILLNSGANRVYVICAAAAVPKETRRNNLK